MYARTKLSSPLPQLSPLNTSVIYTVAAADDGGEKGQVQDVEEQVKARLSISNNTTRAVTIVKSNISDGGRGRPEVRANGGTKRLGRLVTTEVPGTGPSKKRKQRFRCAKVCDCIPARLVLYFLSWSGFLVSFMMRNDINFAVVAMTRSTTTPLEKVSNSTSSEINCGSKNFSVTTTTLLPAASNNHHGNYHNDYDHFQFEWSTSVKSVIVSSFYWCYVMSQVVGGIATQYFGTKHVFGWSQFATAACSLCIPLAADCHYIVVIGLRSIQGFASGLTWPAMYAIVGHWIPLAERSRFMSSFQGFSIGIGLTYPLCGFLIDRYGWPYVFYTTGTLGMLWCLMWYLLAFNTPRQHPRITRDELLYIEQNVIRIDEAEEEKKKIATVNCNANYYTSEDEEYELRVRRQVPWRSIFLSLPAWSIGITTFGRIWVHYIFIVCGPNFMKNMLKFKYQANGFLSGMPFICSYVSSVLFCAIADQLILRRWLTLTAVRKLFTALSQIIPGLLLYWIGYIQHITLLLVVWFVAVIFITASYAGAMANIVDIAPQLAGPVLAFCQTIHMSASFLSPLVAGIIITDESSIDQWRTVFAYSSAIAILSYLVYQFYGTADIQAWNYTTQLSTTAVAVTLPQSNRLNGGDSGDSGSSKEIIILNRQDDMEEDNHQ